MSGSEPVIRTQALTKTYGEGEAAQTVLKGIDLELPRGTFAALLGRSGSGKSTLLLILGTLMSPTGGRLEILGQDVLNLSESELVFFRNRHIGFVFQFHYLLPDLTSLENVMFPSAVSAGRETPAARKRATELLNRVGLSERINYRPTALSGGQKQRVAIARALMNRPAVILADEPTGNLDRESADQVMVLLNEINEEGGTSFLISTHDEQIARQCRSRIRLDDGRIVSSED